MSKHCQQIEESGGSSRAAHHPVASRYLSGRIRSAAIPVQHHFVVIIHSLTPEPLGDEWLRVVLAQAVDPVALSLCSLHSL